MDVMIKQTIRAGKMRVILFIQYEIGSELLRLPVTNAPLMKKKTMTAICPE
jgi:hypothetical protein